MNIDDIKEQILIAKSSHQNILNTINYLEGEAKKGECMMDIIKKEIDSQKRLLLLTKVLINDLEKELNKCINDIEGA